MPNSIDQKLIIMKRLILVSLAACTMVACNMVRFEVPQPNGVQNLSKIPEKLTGMFIGSDHDTLMVDVGWFSFKSTKGDMNVNMKLSDSTVLRQYNNYYFLSSREDNGWNVVVVEPKSGDRVTIMMLYVDNTDKLARIQKIVKLKEIKKDDGDTDYYLTNPTKEQLVQLLDQGLFEEIVTLRRPLKN